MMQVNKHSVFLTQHKTITGQWFDPNDNIWEFNDLSNKLKIDFTKLPLNTSAIISLKRTFIWYLENYSLSHARNMHDQLLRLLQTIYTTKKIVLASIQQEDLLNWGAEIGKDREWWLGAVAGFLQKWKKLDYYAISDEAIDYLNETSFPGNPKGEAVRTHDPYKGPLIEIEQQLILNRSINAYANGSIESHEYILIWLFSTYGPRPVQLASLKLCDLERRERKNGTFHTVLNIPRAKQQGANNRDLFTERNVPIELEKALFGYQKQQLQKFKDLLEDPMQAPFFPSENIGSLPHFEYHYDTKSIAKILINAINSFKIKSPRTSDLIKITPRRFRYSLGTRAAIEGAGELVIAELLDHSDTQNISVYIEARPEYIKRIDKAIALLLAHLAQAFAGILLKDKSKATRAGDPTSLIKNYTDNGCQTLGGCGTYSFCAQMAPIACYTCGSFEPFADAPHEEILQTLLDKREELLQTTDERIASINDTTIIAVAEVVKQCMEINNNGDENE